jgi:hypothetical protein
MDLIILAQEGLKIINRADFTKAANAATLGQVAVQVIYYGTRLFSFIIGRKKDAKTEQPDAIEIESENDVAVLVDINRRMMKDVARYLQQKGIKANLIVVTNDPDYTDKVCFLDPNNPDEWDQVVREFNAVIGKIKHTVGGAHLHIFLSTPLPIAFGLGSVWGTVDEATIYHYQDRTYYPTMKITRSLRQ